MFFRHCARSFIFFSFVLHFIGVGCSQTPVDEPVRTFERAEHIDVVCIKVRDENGVAIPAEPAPFGACGPVSVNAKNDTRALLSYHLFALVTQTARGEVALVDLTVNKEFDPDRTTPGINPAPVGDVPTDLSISKGGKYTFVTAAEANKYALYMIQTTALLGDGYAVSGTRPPLLTDWSTCQFEQRPVRVLVVPKDPSDNAGLGDYSVAVALQGDASHSAKLAIFSAETLKLLSPGTMNPCKPLSTVELTKTGHLLTTENSSQTWPLGAPYLDPSEKLPLPPLKVCLDSSDQKIATPPPSEVRIGKMTADSKYVYLADTRLPLVHVVSIEELLSPKEIEPLLLARKKASTLTPQGVKDMALSPFTSDYKRYLYAIDDIDGSLAVFDVTSPPNGNHQPLHRPHPELYPQQAIDRVSLDAPAATLGFVRHDWPLTVDSSGNQLIETQSGVLCRPNLSSDPGSLYRANGVFQSQDLGPSRLRGIFAFVALEDGRIEVVDVDDWDGPCRRPQDLQSKPINELLKAALFKGDDVWNIPVSGTGDTTEEVFFPVSSPHQPRSSALLKRTDSKQVARAPQLANQPDLYLKNVPAVAVGPDAERNPILLPSLDPYINHYDEGKPPPSSRYSPSSELAVPGVQLAWEEPRVHVDQDWSITYEGVLPGFTDSIGDISPVNQGELLRLNGSNFCSKGVQDFRVSSARARDFMKEASNLGLELGALSKLDKQSADYVQISDELLAETDPYWALPLEECSVGFAGRTKAQERYDLCNETYGEFKDESLERDFPILEAYEDHFMLGRFGYPDGPKSVATREVVASHSSNISALARARCCFHSQIKFRVRTGSNWLAKGSTSGVFHHVVHDQNNACVISCDETKRLLESRSFTVPRPTKPSFLPPSRDSLLALRNPIFSYVVYGSTVREDDLLSGLPSRGHEWRFRTQNGFQPFIVSITQNVQVRPQALIYLESLGQMAVVDGLSQGLVLIELGRPSSKTVGIVSRFY